MNLSMLKRSEILDITPVLSRQAVNVPEWGGEVVVRAMTAGERDRFEVLISDGKRADFRASLAVFAVCDDAGVRLFNEADIAKLTLQPASALDRIAEAALALSRFTQADVEAMEKNSGRGHSNGNS